MKKYSVIIHRVKLRLASFLMRLRNNKKHFAKVIAFSLVLALIMGRVATYYVSGAGATEVPTSERTEEVTSDGNEVATVNENKETTESKDQVTSEATTKHQKKSKG